MKIGSIVLIVTKIYYPKGVCGFQCKCKQYIYYFQAYISVHNSQAIHISCSYLGSYSYSCLYRVYHGQKTTSLSTVAGVFLMRPPLGPHLLVPVLSSRRHRKQTGKCQQGELIFNKKNNNSE